MNSAVVERPSPLVVVELLKPITWFPPMWALGCGIVSSGVSPGQRWPLIVAGVLLAGRATKAYQAMGDEFLLPSIAAVVLGGTNILGGRGKYLGTVAGVILIVLLQSILSVMQMNEAWRQVIYGAVIITMLLVYGRGSKVQQ